jgi:hypothetical protein
VLVAGFLLLVKRNRKPAINGSEQVTSNE